MKKQDRRWLALFFFVSGATGLMLQVAWSKELSYLLGNTLYAIATVVAAFMGGLGLGSALASRLAEKFRNPVRTYGGMELCIALCGALSIPLFRSMEGVFGALYALVGDNHALFLLMRFLVVFLVMAVPATLMGMTLPVVVGAIGRRQEEYEGGAGRLYGINTIGAVAGTLFAGFWIVPGLGLLGTCLTAAALQAGVAGAALWLSRRVGELQDLRVERRAEQEKKKKTEEAPPPPLEAARWTGGMMLVGGIYAVSGALAMVYEVGWFRLLALIIGPSVHAFSMMLVVYLAGVGLGSVLAAKWAQRLKSSRDWFAAMEAAIGFTSLLGLAFVNRLPEIYYDAFNWTRKTWMGQEGYVAAQAMVASVVVFLPTFLMGAMFPVVVRAFRESASGAAVPEKAVGRMYALNTAGAIAGSLAAGFFLVPGIGIWNTLALASLLSLLLGLVLWMGIPESWWQVPRLASAGVCAAAFSGFCFLLPSFNSANLNQGSYRKMRNMDAFSRNDLFDPSNTLLYYSEGINTTVAVFRLPGHASLRVTGKADASSLPVDLYTQIFVGQLPMLFAREHKHAAVIGYGSGVSAGTMLRHPDLESLDIIEIERGVIGASPYFAFLNDSPVDDPRGRLILEDGRIHMTYTGKFYDVIASEPSNPWISGVSNLFTVDFYRTVDSRLSEKGVFCQWIQLYELSEDTFKVMLATLQEVFPHVVIFLSQPSDVVVLASRQPIKIPWETYQARFRQPGVTADFAKVGIMRPEDILFYFLASDERVQDYTRGAMARNTDDNVWLEHRMPREFFTTQDALNSELPGRFATGRVPGIESMLPGIPVEEALRQIVSYAYSKEPQFMGNGVIDILSSWRAPVLAGLWEDIKVYAENGLPDRIRGHEAAVKGRYENTTRAATLVLKALIDPQVREKPSLGNDYIREAAMLDPELPVLLAMVGNGSYDAQNYAEAESIYRQLRAKPWSPAFYDGTIGLANIYARRGEFDEAWKTFAEAQQFNPYISNAFTEAAKLYKQRGLYAKAAETVRKGLFFNPGDASLVNLRRDLEALEKSSARPVPQAP
jgi:spermidine synthase